MTAAEESDGEYEPSPVPADRDLWPGELPFTAWGQHEYGSLDLRVFDQDVWWVDIAQRPHRIGEMSAEYIRNVIEFLVADAKYFYYQTMRRELAAVAGDLVLGRVSAELVAMAVGGPSLTDFTPEEWLESTTLMRALRRRAAADEEQA
jgi:hypothetical protein